MSWASPMLALWGALAAVPALLLLYFLKLRRRTVDVSTTLLWRRAVQDLQANAPFQRLRRNILLLLQLLILAALLAAVAQPELRTDLPVGKRVVILVDRSASMNATDAEPGSRFAAARRQALALVESLRQPGPFASGGADEAMVIAFGPGAEVVAPFTSDRQRLREAIESIEPTGAPAELEPAMRLARARTGAGQPATNQPGEESREKGGEAAPADGAPERPRPVIHLLTDGGLADASSVTDGADKRLVYHAVGTSEAANIGLTALRAERSYRDPERVTIFVGLQSTASEARQVEVELRAAGQVRVYELTVPPRTSTPDQGVQPGEASTTIEFTHPNPGTVRLSLGGEGVEGDVLGADNTGWLALGPARRLRVACVTPGNLFLRSALEGMSLAELTFFTPDEFASALASGEADRYDALVLDRWLPERAASGEDEGPGEGGDAPSLPRGSALVLGGVPTGIEGISLGEPGPGGALLATAPGHPALRDVSLAGVELVESPTVEIGPAAPARVLAETARGPAIFEVDQTDRRAVVVAFNVLESTWPWDVSFPVFISSAVEALAGGAGREGEGEGGAGARTGSLLTQRLPAGARNVRVRIPNDAGEPGPTHELSLDADSRISFGPLERVGLYELSWRGEPGAGDRREGGRSVRTLAANLLSPRESDVRVPENLETASSVVSAAGSGRATRRTRLWPWLILVAVGVLMLEWWIYNRKVQI